MADQPGKANEIEARGPAFPGFDPPSANFTPAPNQFFDRILGHYPLCVVTVVGILMRETLGWRDSVTGERRIEAEVPLTAFIRPGLSKNSARQGLREAMEAGFVVKTADNTNQDGSRYALRWADTDHLREAVTRQRRAVGDARPLADSLLTPDTATAANTETAAENGGEGARPGGLKSGGPNFGPPKSGGPEIGPPTVKKRSPEKKRVSVKKTLETFNVSGDENTYQNPELGGQETSGTDPDSDTALESRRLAAVRSVLAITGDTKSAARFAQLHDICDESGELSAWDEALASAGKAKATPGRLRGTAGAYFNGTLAKILLKRGVAVPTGNPADRAALQAEILASLGLNGAERGTDSPAEDGDAGDSGEKAS